MAGYIGKSQGVTQVDGYNRSEADTRYVNTAGDTMTGALSAPEVAFNAARNVRMAVYGSTNAVSTDDGGVEIQVDTSFRVYENDDVNALAFEVDGNSGAVRAPRQPAFHAKKITDANWANGVITFTSAVLNVGSNYSTSTSRFTAPVDGVYFFSATLSINGGSTGQDDTMNWGFYKNGVANFETQDNWSVRNDGGGNGVEIITNMTAVIQLSASDYIDIRSSGIATFDGLVGGDSMSHFVGYLIG